MHYLHQNWRNKSDIEDLRQEVYARVCEAAQKEVPEKTKAFVLTTARNLLINRVRRERIVTIDSWSISMRWTSPSTRRGRTAARLRARKLRRLQIAIDHLPPRCPRSGDAKAVSRDFRVRKSRSAWASARRLCPSISRDRAFALANISL